MTQVASDYHFSKKYASLERFISYFYQTKLIGDCSAKKILFIGVGDGLVPHLLKQNKRHEVVTLDFDEGLRPDVVGDIRKLPFADKTFDLVCAFEVLEHIPWAEALEALTEIKRVCKKSAIISVPHRRTGFELTVKFPFIRTLLNRDFVRLAIRLPLRFPGFAVSGQHYWEIDGRSPSLKDFRSAVSKNFHIQKEATPVLSFYERFFCLTV